MTFDVKNSEIFDAVELSRFLSHWTMKRLRNAFFILGFCSFALYGLSLLGAPNILIFGFLSRLMLGGLSYLLIALGMSVLFFEIYFDSHLKNPKVRDADNIAEFLDFDAAEVLARAFRTSIAIGEQAVTTSALLLGMTDDELAGNIFVRLGFSPEEIKGLVLAELGIKNLFPRGLMSGNLNYSEDFLKLMADANGSRIKQGFERICVTDLITALYDNNGFFRRLLDQKQLNKEDLNNLDYWYKKNVTFQEKRKKFWELENRLRRTPIGVSWIYGYAWILKKFTSDLTAKYSADEAQSVFVGRSGAVGQIEEVLSRTAESNILLVGEPGVGKKTIVEELARMISAGKSLPQLNFKRVLDLDIASIISSSKESAEIQNNLTAVLNEAVKAGNIILVVNNLHNFLGTSEGIGKSDISGILIPYLESNRVQIIATTDPTSFHKFIESRADLLKVFEKIDIEETTQAETIEIIETIVPAIEAKYKVWFLYSAIKKIVEDSDRFIKLVPFPEKAIDLLSETVAYVQSKKTKVVSDQDVDEVVTRKTKIPLGKIGTDERSKLINLETEMAKEVIGQDEAVKVVSQTMQRLRAGLSRRNKPAGVFLFVGPTGVGKTQTAKTLAKTYFGSESQMIRFDMSEYQDLESMDRFLGSLRMNEPGRLVTTVRDNPFSLILLDEIEKAHKDILNIFLQVFDEGSLTDVFGRKVSFEENIIIATSNAGADYIRDLVNEGTDPSLQKEKLIDVLVKGRHFTPEFLNRFDEIVIYHPLTREQLIRIAEIMVNALTERLRQQGYLFKASSDVIAYIAKVGFDPQFGARPMQRAIQDKLESVIARKILNQEVSKGTEFTLSASELG